MFCGKKTIWNLGTILMTVVILLVIGTENTKADFIFGEPVYLGPTVNSPNSDPLPSISADGLELYFESYRSGGLGNCDVWVTRRATVDDEWGRPTNLGATVNTSSWDGCPSISADGLSLYFWSFRSGGYGNCDLWVTTRATRNDDWTTPVNLGATVNSAADEMGPAISFDGLELYFCEYSTFRPGGVGNSDLWITERPTVSEPWGTPRNLGPTVNSLHHERYPCISPDGLLLLFAVGDESSNRIWLSRRVSTVDEWSTPVKIGPTINEFPASGPNISADGHTLYFHSNRPGGYGNNGWDLWQAPIIPIVDFNGDGITDVKDVLTMTEHWAQNYSLCDIGPMPWGDGVVDVRDLEVLIEYIEPIDYTLIAHWTLDETEGIFAHNSVKDNNDYVMGGPTWQPAGGMIDGALELDGIDDCIISSAKLNLAEGPFSVFAWIKCSTPGKAIISQPNGSDWLAIGADGNLITELAGSGNNAAPLISQALIADEQWHRIGFVWNGSKRTLYVDGFSVAEDTQYGLVGLDIGLYIGVGKNYTVGTFFSGLIDDVQIYKGAVSP